MSEPATAELEIKRRPDRAALAIAAGLFALAGLLAWNAGHLGGGGAYARIGPQTIPFAIAIGLLGLAVWTVIEALHGDFPGREPQQTGPLLWIIGGLVAQMVLLKIVGFSIATGILFAMAARGFGRISLPWALIGGVALSALVWFVFARLLQLSLPAGPLERLMVEGADLISAPFWALPARTPV